MFLYLYKNKFHYLSLYSPEDKRHRHLWGIQDRVWDKKSSTLEKYLYKCLKISSWVYLSYFRSLLQQFVFLLSVVHSLRHFCLRFTSVDVQ